jgi:hypothetical protein
MEYGIVETVHSDRSNSSDRSNMADVSDIISNSLFEHFDINNMKDNSLAIIIGKRECGKSNLIVNIISSKSPEFISNTLFVAPTDEHNPTKSYKKTISDS